MGLAMLKRGPLTGGPQCRMSLVTIFVISMSILKWAHVACRFQEIAYVMSFIISLLSIGPMSHVDFKKWPCRHVELRGQRPKRWG